MDSKKGDWKSKNESDPNYQFPPKIPISYYFPRDEGRSFNEKFSQELNPENSNRPFQSDLPYGHHTPPTQPQFNTNNYRVNQVNWGNISNMNINIINQIPMAGQGPSYINEEDLADHFNKINISNTSQGTKKDTYYNYYFGNPPDEKQKYVGQKNYLNKFNDSEVPNYNPQQMNYTQQNKMPNYNQFPNMTNDSNYSNYSNYSNDQMSRMANYGNMHTPEKEYLQNKKQYNKGYSQMDRYPNEANPSLNPERIMYRSSDTIPGRFFVLKSVDEDNVHKSVKYRIWCSTPKGNQKLHKAFKEADNKYPIYLFFSVNGSGRFLGLAQMSSEVENKANFNFWSQNEKWRGFFFVVWLTIKDIPNRAFRHIINEYNENKPVTSSRDTQEIPPIAGAEMLKIFSKSPYETSILDDFKFYEQKQDSNLSKVKNNPSQEETRFQINPLDNSNISNTSNSEIIDNFNTNSREFVPLKKMFKKVSSENQLSHLEKIKENNEEI